MDLLSAIRNQLGIKKKEEQLFTPAMPTIPMSKVGSQPLMSMAPKPTAPTIGTSILNGLSKAYNFLAPGFEANTYVGQKILDSPVGDVVRSTVRSIPEVAMSYGQFISPQKNKAVSQINLPKDGPLKDIIGTAPLKTIQKRGEERSKEWKLPATLTTPLIGLGTILDLPGPGIAKEGIESEGKNIIKSLSKQLDKEGTSFLRGEFERLVKPTKEFIGKLIGEGKIELPRHTITYTPSTTGEAMIDVIPKVVEKTKATVKVAPLKVETVDDILSIPPKTKGVKVPKPKDIYVDELGETVKKPGRIKVGQPKDTIPTLIRDDNGKIIKPTTRFGEGPDVPVIQTKKLADQTYDEAETALRNETRSSPFTDLGNTPTDRVPQTKSLFNQTMDDADDVLSDMYGARKVPKKVTEVLGADDVGQIVNAIPKMKDVGAGRLTTRFLNRALEKIGGGATEVGRLLKRVIYEPVKIAGVRWADDMDSYAKRINQAFSGISLGDDLDKAIMTFGEKYGNQIATNTQAVSELADYLKSVNKQDKMGQVINAIVESRKVYDELLGAINQELVRFGYTQMPSLPNYFTHIAQLTDVNGKFFPVLKNLETSMAGLNFITKPGKTFAQFALKRRGDTPEVASALAGLKRYIPVALQQVHYMDSIQRLRAVAQLMRNQVGNLEGVSPTHLSEVVGWLDRIASSIAGKNIGLYKLAEEAGGRQLADWIKTADSFTGLNLMAYNIGASLSNLAVLTNALARTGVDSFGKAIASTVSNISKSNLVDGLRSEFLTGRYYEKVGAKNITEKANDLGMKLFEVIDRFASETVLRSFYDDFLKKGMTPEDALRSADQLAMEQIGNRMIGMPPLIIKQLPVITKFALEPMNYIDTIISDIPRDYRDKVIDGAWLLSKIIVLNYTANEVYEKMTGRRILPDVLYLGQNIKQIWDKPGDTGSKIAQTVPLVAKEIPVVQTFAGGGRVPISAGLPDINTMTEDPVAALIKVSTLFNPFGGSQEAYKIYTALKDYNRGYAQDRSGRVKYTVDQTPTNLARVPMGKYAFPESVRYYEEGLTPLGSEDSNLLKNTPQDKQSQLYGTMAVDRKTREPQSLIRSRITEWMNLSLDPNVSREEKIKALQQLGPYRQQIMDYYPNEIKRFAKVMGINLDQLFTAEDTPNLMTLPKPLEQTEMGGGLLDIPSLNLSTGKGKVSNKKVSLKKTPGIKVSAPKKRTSKLVVKKRVAPKLKVSKRKGISIAPRKPMVRYRKASVGGLKVKV